MNDTNNSLNVDQLLDEMEQMQDQIDYYQKQNAELKTEVFDAKLASLRSEEAMAARDEEHRNSMALFKKSCIDDRDEKIRVVVQEYALKEKRAWNQVKEERDKLKRCEARERFNLFLCLLTLAFLAAYIFSDIVPWRPFFLPGLGEAIVFWWFVFGLVITWVHLKVLKVNRI